MINNRENILIKDIEKIELFLSTSLKSSSDAFKWYTFTRLNKLQIKFI